MNGLRNSWEYIFSDYV